MPPLSFIKSQALFLRQTSMALLDIIAPPRCMGCLEEGTWLCNTCWQHESAIAGFFSQRCIVCGQERPRGMTCLKCRPETFLVGCISAGPYGSPTLRRAIHWLKFKGVKPVAVPLAQFLVPRLPLILPIEQLQSHALLIPLPLHKKRLRERGFNQSEEIAQALSKATGIPVATHVLTRAKITHAQTRLPHDLRGVNVAEAFECSGTLPNVTTIILLDDVATTGATLHAAAKALRSVTNASLWGITLARG